MVEEKNKKKSTSKAKKGTDKKKKPEQKPKSNTERIKDDLKRDLAKAQKIISSYAIKILNIEIERDKIKENLENSANQFKEKAKEFSTNAQEQINEFKENYKNKINDEIGEIKKYASQNLIKDLIEPLINFRLAVNSGKNMKDGAVRQFVIGFDMLLNQIDSVLEFYGAKKINPKVGDKFDEHLHQAIKLIKGPKNKIIEVKIIGYEYNGRIIKPAIVIVGKGA
jgi:molecular chaperone GrpE